ncbi:MAG: prolipoprotein diacylglyceryl transferase [Deltaproteobacteria bacterium]|nr:prolipoprotein diacylglyceryl transferase [Deltaproteobacteria bacterium]
MGAIAREAPATPGAGRRRRWPGIGARNSYRRWGLIGFGLGAAVLLTTAQLSQRGLVLGLVVVASCVASFGIATKLSVILFGAERIVFFQQTLAALGLSAGVLSLTGRPLRAGLDLAMIGIGAFLVLGRVGCLTAGCCYGRPARRGVRYPRSLAAAGFPRHLVGVALLPIQLAESLLSLLLVIACITVVLAGWAPGSAVALYLLGYGFARLWLELARGDEARPVGLGLSEAQWTAPLIAWLLAWRGGGRLVWAAVGLTALAAGLGLYARRARWTRWWLRVPARTRQLGEALLPLLATPTLTRAETRYGLRLSSSLNPDGSRHFALSRCDATAPLDAATAARVARELGLLLGATPSPPVAGRTPGLFHLDVPAQGRLASSARSSPM